ncbi:MAG: OsmC family protein [Chloroflexi bacterium]|nr:OsmC family protein [Chloroflexota bacterium]
MTLTLYAKRKGWPLDGVTAELSHERVHARDCQECEEDDNTMLDVIRIYLVLKGDLSEEQVERLSQISERCPVHRTLQGGPRMFTEVDHVKG